MRFRSSLFALAVFAFSATPAHATPKKDHDTTVTASYVQRADSVQVMPNAIMSVTTNKDKTVPNTVPLAPMSLVFAGAVAGVTKVNRKVLGQSYIFNGETYGPTTPGEAVLGGTAVPDDFPDIDESGRVLHPEGSAAARNAARFSSPPNSGGVYTGESGAIDGAGTTGGAPAQAGKTVSGVTAEDLEKMKVDDLEELAVNLSIPVSRGDGTDGDPLKADYVAALSKPA